MIETEWFPNWRGQVVVLVASGPGAKGVPLEIARGRARFGVVNRSYQLAPWADVMYAADWRYWESVNGCPDFRGMKITCDANAARNWSLRHVECRRKDDRIMAHERGVIGGGGSSGFQLFDLVLQWGPPAAVLLVGFDATVAHGTHWHGNHTWKAPNSAQRLGNPKLSTAGKWRRAMDGAAKRVAEAGVRVINCSPLSALKAYPVMVFEEALESCLCASPS